MRKRTSKRAGQEAEYRTLCAEIDAEAKANDTYKCVFCGKPLKGMAFHHHSRGREGDLITEKKWIWLCHFSCHQEYHDLPVRKQTWRPQFLEWLKYNDEVMYLKEFYKESK